MKEKKEYRGAEIDIVLLQSADVISTSSVGDEVMDKDGWA